MAKQNDKGTATTEAHPQEQPCPPNGHKWELPQINPFNVSGSLECPIRCSRCDAKAQLSITLNEAAQS